MHAFHHEPILPRLITCWFCLHNFTVCMLTLIVPDPCLSGPCDINATCTREALLNSNFTCSCQEPFIGNGFACSCKLGFHYILHAQLLPFNSMPPPVPDPCLSGPCHSNASCMREGLRSGGFQCECDPGYQGDGLNCLGTYIILYYWYCFV